jgi:hypothetical protein
VPFSKGRAIMKNVAIYLRVTTHGSYDRRVFRSR